MKKLSMIIFGIFISFFLIFLFVMPFSDKIKVNVFKYEEENYKIKIIENHDYRTRGMGVEKNIFYSEIRKDNQVQKIGCGELILIGIDKDKKYLYGKLKYYNNKGGIGIYKNFNTPKELIARDSFFENNSDIFKQLCDKNFILNLETGEYKSNLSDEEFSAQLEIKELNKKLNFVEKFLNKNGKILIYNFKDIEYWMTTREP